MTRATALTFALALAACGDNAAVPGDADGAADAAPAPCIARFSGNFAETSISDACATIAPGDGTAAALSLSVPSTTLGGPLSVTIDLGLFAAPGSYAPETVPSWSARAVAQIGNGACVYLAGSAATPQGSFTLSLAEADATTGAAHGMLALEQSVLAFPGTDCGDVDTERTEISF